MLGIIRRGRIGDATELLAHIPSGMPAASFLDAYWVSVLQNKGFGLKYCLIMNVNCSNIIIGYSHVLNHKSFIKLALMIKSFDAANCQDRK